MPRPNFFIIGAPKSGTTALAHYLAEHPQIHFATPKELFYFSDDHPIARTRHNVHCDEDYLRYFCHADPRTKLAIGEGSTNYLQSHTAIENILKFNSESRFVVLLRNPVEVAYGMHGELLRHFFEDEPDFEKAWQLQESRANGENIPKGCVMVNQLQYRDVASYAQQLERLFALVPEDRRRVFIFDDFKSNTQSVYRQTITLLGIEDDGRQHFPKVNAARQYRYGVIGRVYQNPPNWVEPAMKRFRVWYAGQSQGIKNIVGGVLSREAPRDRLRPEFERFLSELFLPEIERVEELLGRDLSDWKRSAALADPNSLRT